MVGGWVWRCYCEPFGHCGIHWHREQSWYNTSIQKFFCSKHCRTDADYFFAHSSITIRLADLKIIGTLQDFLRIHLLVCVIAFYCFLLESKCFHSHLGTKYFLADFLLLIPWLEEQEAGWSFEASLDSIIFNLEPSAPKIQNKIRSRQNFSIVHSELSSHCQIRRLDLPFPGSRQNIFMKPRIGGKDD